MTYAFSFFFFPAWCTFENINPCPRKFIARKINSPTYKGAMPTPPPPPNKIILSLFFLEDKTLAPDVFSSCSFIPRAYFEARLVIVRCYGYKIWRHKYKVVKPFLGENVCFFQLLSTIKANLVAKIVQSAYLYVIFYVKHKKITISSGFNLIFNLEKLA